MGFWSAERFWDPSYFDFSLIVGLKGLSTCFLMGLP